MLFVSPSGARRIEKWFRNRDIDIDIGRTIQWVEYQQVTAAWLLARNCIGLGHFFGGHPGQHAVESAMAEHDFVGEDVQFLLGLSLGVGA